MYICCWLEIVLCVWALVPSRPSCLWDKFLDMAYSNKYVEELDSFYVFLPSDGDTLGYHKENRNTSYTIGLKEALKLDSRKWMVGISEIVIPQVGYNVIQPMNIFKVMNRYGRNYLRIAPGIYTPDSFSKACNAAIADSKEMVPWTERYLDGESVEEYITDMRNCFGMLWKPEDKPAGTEFLEVRGGLPLPENRFPYDVTRIRMESCLLCGETYARERDGRSMLEHYQSEHPTFYNVWQNILKVHGPGGLPPDLYAQLRARYPMFSFNMHIEHPDIVLELPPYEDEEKKEEEKKEEEEKKSGTRQKLSLDEIAESLRRMREVETLGRRSKVREARRSEYGDLPMPPSFSRGESVESEPTREERVKSKIFGGKVFFDEASKKLYFELDANGENMRFYNDKMREMMGFDASSQGLVSAGGHRIPYFPAEKDQGLVRLAHPAEFDLFNRLMYVYSNIVRRSAIGSHNAPLLRIVSLNMSNRSIESSVIHHTYDPPHYYSLAEDSIKDINIQLRDFMGDEIPLQTGKVVVVLQFKKRTES